MRHPILQRAGASLLIALPATLPLAAAAQEPPSPWTLRVGPAAVNFAHARSDLWVGGSSVAGGDVAFKNNTALAFELGYALSPAWTARFAFGIPPTTRLSAAGSLRQKMPPLSGRLGDVKYGPAVLSLTYALGDIGRLRPYVGAGINYTLVLGETDGDIGRLKVKNTWGSVLQAGADYRIDEHWSIFLDVRKIYAKTTATGTIPAFGSPPAYAEVRLDPLIVHTGVSYRF